MGDAVQESIPLYLGAWAGVPKEPQVFPTWYIKRTFRHAEDKRLHHVNVEAFVQAAATAFPAWLRPLQVFRFGLATVGSVVVILLLAL